MTGRLETTERPAEVNVREDDENPIVPVPKCAWQAGSRLMEP